MQLLHLMDLSGDEIELIKKDRRGPNSGGLLPDFFFHWIVTVTQATGVDYTQETGFVKGFAADCFVIFPAGLSAPAERFPSDLKREG